MLKLALNYFPGNGWETEAKVEFTLFEVTQRYANCVYLQIVFRAR